MHIVTRPITTTKPYGTLTNGHFAICFMRFFSEYVEHTRFVLLLLDPAKKGGTISLVMRWVACVAGNRSAFVVSVSCRKCFCFVSQFQFQLSFIFKYLKKTGFYS